MVSRFFRVAVSAYLILVASLDARAVDISPREYGSVINEVFRQVGSDLRLWFDGCWGDTRLICRFSSARVKVVVDGSARPRSIGKIVIEADVLRDTPDADPLAVDG